MQGLLVHAALLRHGQGSTYRFELPCCRCGGALSLCGHGCPRAGRGAAAGLLCPRQQPPCTDTVCGCLPCRPQCAGQVSRGGSGPLPCEPGGEGRALAIGQCRQMLALMGSLDMKEEGLMDSRGCHTKTLNCSLGHRTMLEPPRVLEGLLQIVRELQPHFLAACRFAVLPQPGRRRPCPSATLGCST